MRRHLSPEWQDQIAIFSQINKQKIQKQARQTLLLGLCSKRQMSSYHSTTHKTSNCRVHMYNIKTLHYLAIGRSHGQLSALHTWHISTHDLHMPFSKHTLSFLVLSLIFLHQPFSSSKVPCSPSKGPSINHCPTPDHNSPIFQHSALPIRSQLKHFLVSLH